MESELSYNTQIFAKDPKYTECEYCNGSGHIYEYDADGELQKEDCSECGGAGVLEIED